MIYLDILITCNNSLLYKMVQLTAIKWGKLHTDTSIAGMKLPNSTVIPTCLIYVSLLSCILTILHSERSISYTESDIVLHWATFCNNAVLFILSVPNAVCGKVGRIACAQTTFRSHHGQSNSVVRVSNAKTINEIIMFIYFVRYIMWTLRKCRLQGSRVLGCQGWG